MLAVISVGGLRFCGNKEPTCPEFQMAFAIRIWKTESQVLLISSLLGNFQRDYHTTCIRLNYSWHYIRCLWRNVNCEMSKKIIAISDNNGYNFI